MSTHVDFLPSSNGKAPVSVLYDPSAIAARVRALGDAITTAYPEGDLLVLGLLKGSFIFVADLVRQIRRPLHVDFLVASSYGNDLTSSGDVRLLYDPKTSLVGKHVLLVEDIVDSGATLTKMVAVLKDRGPKSLAVCALLDKTLHHEPFPDLKFVGFEAPSSFVVGYGLDHAEDCRHLPFIAELM